MAASDQVAMLELVKAATRFDPERGVDFVLYAYPCVIGGLKKHFRDTGRSHRAVTCVFPSLRIARRIEKLRETALGAPRR